MCWTGNLCLNALKSQYLFISGKYVNHKGRNRHFTDVEELEQERKKAEAKKWRKKNEGDEEESSEESEPEDEKSAKGDDDSESEEESSSEEDDNLKKGVQGLIEIENPNRVKKKTAQKVTALPLEDAAGSSSKPELSRREREELDKQRAQANYQRLHAQGKTEQARADLARLAIIKQHRAEAAARREAERKGKATL